MPSWPTAWNIDFKLHAPSDTVVVCVYENGKIVRRDLTPRVRDKDVLDFHARDENHVQVATLPSKP